MTTQSIAQVWPKASAGVRRNPRGAVVGSQPMSVLSDVGTQPMSVLSDVGAERWRYSAMSVLSDVGAQRRRY